MLMLRLYRSRPHLSRHMTGLGQLVAAGLGLLCLCLSQAGVAAQPYADIELYKSAGQTVAHGDGTYTATFELTVRNTGSDDLISLQIEDDLNIFGDGQLVSLGQTEIISGSLTPNPAYDGRADVRLLAGHDRLKPGEESSLRFAVTFEPGDTRRAFTNDAIASGIDERSGEHLLASSWCTFEILPTPEITLVKELVGAVLDNGDGTRSVSMRLTVSNSGNETLANIQIDDPLDIFSSGRLLEIEGLDSSNLTVNSLYTGIADSRLLTGADTLAASEVGTVTLRLRFDPGNEPGPFVNRAVATANGVDSHMAVTADAAVSFAAGPPPPPPPPVAISLTKELLGDVIDNGDGSRSVSFRLTVTNDAADTLTGLQLEDPLDIFRSGRLTAIFGLSSDNLAIDPGFDGAGNPRILAGTDLLAPGDSGSVTFSLRFEPGNEPGPFVNRAIATATGQASNTPVNAESEVSFPASPPPPPPPPIAILLAKALVGDVIDNGDGSRSASFSLTVSNTGAERLVDIQLEDPLDFFGSGQLLDVADLASTRLAINPLFDGTTDARLLTGADILATDESGTVSFTLRFAPGSEAGPFTNRAIATGVGETSATSVSDDAVASFPVGPPPPPPPPVAIELDKELVGDVLTNADGSRFASFRLVVNNVGAETLTGVQLEDSLNIFGAGALLGVDNLQSDTLQVDLSFDGAANAQLLTGTDTLSASESGVVTFRLRFDPSTETGPFTNRAVVTGRGETSNTTVTDDAEASFPVGSPPPPPTPIAIELDKALTGDVFTNADGSRSASFSLTVSNIDAETLTGIQISDPLDIFGAGEFLGIDDLASDTLAINPSFNGTTDSRILLGQDTLATDESGTVTFTLRFDPGTEPGPLINRAVATGVGETSTTSVSDDAVASFPVGPPPPPPIAIELSKELVGEVVTSSDGSRSASFSLAVLNAGTETLAGVQIDDPLDIFGTGEFLGIVDLSSDTLAINPSFNGTADSSLLTGQDALAAGETGVVNFTLRFDPGAETGPFINRAVATGVGETSNTPVTDDASVAFPVGPPPPPPPPVAIELGKALVDDVMTNADGSRSASFSLTVLNAGTETLAGIQIDDPLDIFGAGEFLGIDGLSSDTLAVNPSFNGTSDSRLLTGADTLAADANGIVTLTVRFDPGVEPGPFINRAVATGRGETSNTLVTDDASVAFPVGPPPPPPPPVAIELDKALVDDVMTNADGSRSASFSLTVLNAGTETLAGVQIDDPLDIFGAGEFLGVDGLESDTLAINPSFNGTTDSLLLSGQDTLTADESGIVTLTVRFDPGTETGPFTNRAVATGRGETSNTPVDDDADVSFSIETPPPLPIAIGLTKEIVSDVVVNDDGSQSVSLRLTVSNDGTETLQGVQLVDPLEIFRTGSLLDVEILEAANLTANSSYDGDENIEVLSGNDTLASGDTGFVTFELRFNAADEQDPFTNRAVATGTGEISGIRVTAEAEVQFSPLTVDPPVTLTKTVDRKTIVRGGLLGYDITISNTGDTDLEDVAVVDNPPEGFRFLSDTTVLIRPGSDDIFDTADDLSVPIDSTGTDPVTFALFDLPGRERARIRYVSRVGTGVAAGEHVNHVMISVCCGPSEESTVPVEVVLDPVFENTTVLGKVFFDADRDGQQDEDERGIPGVRLATVGGLIIETDAHGRYHLADVEVSRAERGNNFIIKLDEGSLPRDYRVFSENPRVVRLTQASMSKVNFAVSAACVTSACATDAIRTDRPDIRPIPVVNGKADVPAGYTTQLEALLQGYRDKPYARLFFYGYSGSEIFTSELAELSRNPDNEIAARDLCELVRDQSSLKSRVDCERVGGWGPERDSAGAVVDKWVGVEVEYFDTSGELEYTEKEAGECAGIAVTQFGLIRYKGEDCAVQPAYEAVDNFATSRSVATGITVSGGQFGCNHQVTEILEGRDSTLAANRRSPKIASLTVFSSKIGNLREPVGTDCNATPIEPADGEPVCEFSGESIVSGQYPIRITTAQCTEILVTGAGDVLRRRYPRNNEQIVVTPFRDESDVSIVTALRISNEGVDPVADADGALKRSRTLSARARFGPNDYLKDPRLDVLAIDPALVGVGPVMLDDAAVLTGSEGHLRADVRFAAYTNYPDQIKDYALDVYGLSRNGFDRELLLTIQRKSIDFDQAFILPQNTDVRNFSELEYVLRAADCAWPFDDSKCHVDSTHPRRLALRSEPKRPTSLDPREVWGKSNLATQNIPVDGVRVRVSGWNEDDDNIRIDGILVPTSSTVPVSSAAPRDNYVVERHLQPGSRHNLEIMSDVVPVAPVCSLKRSATAEDIEISGGLFGCGTLAGTVLPGRNALADPRDVSAPAITVLADHNGAAKSCPPEDNDELRAAVNNNSCSRPLDDEDDSEYHIKISTKAGTVLHINAAGDVLRKAMPGNHEHIVVTPFRDYTDSSQISALRIVNEGKEPEPDRIEVTDPTSLAIDVRSNSHFMVGLASLTVGKHNLSGNAGSLATDEHFDESIFTDGRLAFYAKGNHDNYFYTAQMDSSEDQLSNFGRNMRRKDPRRIFRQLDADRHYAVYGDDSTTISDVDTQGALYGRLDWNRNTALWGNYNTGMTDTEFMQYNRSLYGAKFRHESQEATSYGDSNSELTVFGSQAQSAAAHVRFQATGGSLYYLAHTDVVQGSEKVWIEVQRRDTEQVVEREILIEGRDYEVDAIQGRILLSAPLSQVVNDRGPSIIRSAPLEGDDVFLLVDYEYVPDEFDFDAWTYGARGRKWFGDHVGLGATTVSDDGNGRDYELNGADLVLRFGEEYPVGSGGSYFSAEFAESSNTQSGSNQVSYNGGLSFESQSTGGAIGGDALALEARVDLSEINRAWQGDVRAWSKTRDAGFSSGRMDQGVETTDIGFEAYVGFGESGVLSAAFTDLEKDQVSRSRVARVQAKGQLGEAITASAEIRHENVERTTAYPTGPVGSLNATLGDGEALLVGARLSYELPGNATVYAAGQTVTSDSGDYRENDLLSIGINSSLNNDIGLNFEVSDGDRGSAFSAAVDFAADDKLNFNLASGIGSGAVSQFSTRYAIDEGQELYGSYTVDPDRTDGERNLLTLGQRRAFGNRLAMFTESQFGKEDRYASAGHVFGMEFDGIKEWRISGTMQFSENTSDDLQFERRALSVGAQRSIASSKFSSRLEYREDTGTNVRSRQYVTSNSLTHKFGDDHRLLGQLNLSWTDDIRNGGRDTRFTEFNIGHAYRPVLSDKLNVLTKYTFLYDLLTESQNQSRPDEHSHLLAVDAIYSPGNRWELGGKLAVKSGKRRASRDAGKWQRFGLRLATARVRFHATRKWDGLAEYRWLTDTHGDNSRNGALVGLYRHLGDNFKLGIGFNFTDFNDDLRLNDYNNSGWFVDVVGKY